MDTGALGQVIKVINKFPSIADNLRISIGAPNHAGMDSVTAVTDNKNYNTGVGAGALVLKADKAKLVWNQSIGKKISAGDAASADFAVDILRSAGRELMTSPASACSTPDLQEMESILQHHNSADRTGRYTMTVVVLMVTIWLPRSIGLSRSRSRTAEW